MEGPQAAVRRRPSRCRTGRARAARAGGFAAPAPLRLQTAARMTVSAMTLPLPARPLQVNPCCLSFHVGNTDIVGFDCYIQFSYIVVILFEAYQVTWLSSKLSGRTVVYFLAFHSCAETRRRGGRRL